MPNEPSMRRSGRQVMCKCNGHPPKPADIQNPNIHKESSCESHCPGNRCASDYLRYARYARSPSDLNISIPMLSLPMNGNWNFAWSGFMLDGASYLSWTARFDTAPVIRFMFSM